METNHNKMSRRQVGAGLGITLDAVAMAPAQVSEKDIKNSADGRQAMVSGHRSTVAMFETYAITGKNQSVRTFARQSLPTLKAHLSAILALEKNMQ